MRDAVKRILPAAFLNQLRQGRNTVAAYGARMLSVSASDFGVAVKRLGVDRGRIVFVHSAFDQMRSVRAAPLEIIEILVDAVGDEGTVVMPAFAMTGGSKVYLEQHQRFDWRRTPSQAGIVSEIFRRMKGTERSMHPTHSVSARGRDAAWLTEGHEQSLTPFDEHSPFQKMADRNALVLRIGDMDAMTFRHFADHKLQSVIPHPVYGEREIPIQLVDREKRESTMTTRAHNPTLSCDHTSVMSRLAREGVMRRGRAGRLRMSLVGVQAYVKAYEDDLRAGRIRHTVRALEQAAPINE